MSNAPWNLPKISKAIFLLIGEDLQLVDVVA